MGKVTGTALSVTSGAGGAALTITGTQFGDLQGASYVQIADAIPLITSWSDTSIVTVIPRTLPLNVPCDVIVKVFAHGYTGKLTRTS